MHAAGPRALSSSTPAASLVAVAVAASRLAPSSRRAFHNSPRFSSKTPSPSSSPTDDPSGAKPQGKPEREQQGTRSRQQDALAEPATEPPTRRSRSSVFTSGRQQRPVRSRTTDELPPVKLPQSFLDNNISTHDPSQRLNTLADDPIWHRGYMGAQWHDWLWQDLEVVFEGVSWNPDSLRHALDELARGENADAVLRRSCVVGETAIWLNLCLTDKWSPAFNQRFQEIDAPRALSDNFLDAKTTSPVVGTILSSGRKIGPDDRWDEGIVSRDNAFIHTQIENHINQVGEPDGAAPAAEQVKTYQAGTFSLDYHGSKIFDLKLLGELTTAVRAELALTPDENWTRKELKRPLVVVNIPNYSGRYPTQKLFKRIASHVEADLVRIDAQDLATVVGGYLGQDTAYSKGPMSILPYRVAEMNGRLVKKPEPSGSGDESEMSNEIEATWVNIRQQASSGSYKSPMEEELQKIKEAAKDYILPSVDRWENLKINAALEQMINAATAKSSNAERPSIIQLDNFVELNMTLEGALLTGRLRSIIDGMWRDGKRIVLVGTSANEDPSDQYTSTLGDVASEECLITVPLQVQRIPSGDIKKERRESLDYLQENMRNIHVMSKAMSGRPGSDASYFSDLVTRAKLAPGLVETLDGNKASGDRAESAGVGIGAFPLSLTSTVLPCSDVYHVARLLHGFDLDKNAPSREVLKYLFDVMGSKSVAQSEYDASEDKNSTNQSQGGGGGSSSSSNNNNNNNSNTSGKQKAEPERVAAGGKYNDVEKKLLTGLVDVKEIHTTFSDVHAPPETISALKLLTSLSLMRPDAFTYGILANDKIPGCLLSGPPGTGETLLAKAVAKESGASMLEVSGASINDMYVGQSEKNVRALFSLAKKLSPLVIFIDEADALFAARGQSRSRPSHRETINQFLREWDGMNDAKAFIMVATNRPFDLDDAVLRRLPRKILVDLPLQTDRASILRILLKDERLDDSVSVDDISRSTTLYSGSDLKNLCVAAAMAAVQEELEDAAKHQGPEPYAYPDRRTIAKRHFDKGAREIAASISEDMDSLKAIRQFDQKYGDQRARSRKPKSMGFGVVPVAPDAEDARVRQPVPA